VHPVRIRAARGFTMVELAVTLAVLAILLGLGVPATQRWIVASKARTAAGFYAEGLTIARQEAMRHNGASRLVLIANDTNGQYDWRVDICLPTAELGCGPGSGVWSTVNSVAGGDAVGGFRSVFRSSIGLPRSSVMVTSRAPEDSDTVYFDARGWVNTALDDNLASLQFAPATGFESAFPTSALQISLGGTAIVCDPSITAVSDSRACPQ